MANLNLTQEKLQALRLEYRRRRGRGKYPRQKMLPEYQSLYPWVLADNTDPYHAFCTYCECRLSAKRSDLGKHETSIKHTENATKHAIIAINDCERASVEKRVDIGTGVEGGGEGTDADDSENPAPPDDDDINYEPYIKQEPFIDFSQISASELNLAKFKESFSGSSYSDADGDHVDQNPDEENTDASSAKRRRFSQPTTESTDTHSQQSADYAMRSNCTPTFSEASATTQQGGYSICELEPAATSHASSTPHSSHLAYAMRQTMQPTAAPCKITIKKISAPIAHVPQPPTAVAVTPHPTSITISKQLPPLKQPLLPVPVTPPPPTSYPVSDSFALFFDSICASVRALPPKLAVEGKIRVMQLIGELEMRAITEVSAEALRQQTATVASSTTK